MPWKFIEQQENVSINLSGLEGLTKDLDDLLKKMPEKRRALHEELAQLAKTEIDAQITASGINDNGGKIRSWQEPHVGSGGGYAAVRATDKGDSGHPSTGDNSPGAITNYHESGYKTRKPSGNAKRPQPGKSKMAYVDGRHFYQKARTSMESKAIDVGNRFADDLAKELGG